MYPSPPGFSTGGASLALVDDDMDPLIRSVPRPLSQRSLDLERSGCPLDTKQIRFYPAPLEASENDQAPGGALRIRTVEPSCTFGE